MPEPHCRMHAKAILRNRRCRFMVLGFEVGGRWNNEVSRFIRMLVPLVCCPYPWSSFFAASLLFEDPSTPRPTPLSDSSPVVPTSHLPARSTKAWTRLPFQLANTKTVRAWRLPRKTALHPRTFLRLKRSEGKSIQNLCRQKKKFAGIHWLNPRVV